MVYLLLSVLFSIVNLAIFRVLPSYRRHLFSVIVWNYPVAFLMGVLLYSGEFSKLSLESVRWLPWAVLIGALFILNFFLIGTSTQKAGMAITSVATKMSFVVPILFSAFYYKEVWTFSKVGGVLLALLAVGSTLKRKKGNEVQRSVWWMGAIPLFLFVLLGITDTLIKYSEGQFLGKDEVTLFTAVLFGTSAGVGFLVVLFDSALRKKICDFPNLFWGVFLGLGNFLCVYFFVLALKSQFMVASSIFAMNNVLVVLGSSLMGKFFFRESFHVFQVLGILMALLSIVFLALGG